MAPRRYGRRGSGTGGSVANVSKVHLLPPDPALARRPLHELADELEDAYDRGAPLPSAVVFEVLRRAMLTASGT